MLGPYSTTPWILTDSANLSYWNAQSLDAGTSVAVSAPNLGFSRCVFVWTRSTPAGTREDVMTSHIDWCSAVGGIAVPLSSAERSSIETALATFKTSMNGYVTSQYTLDSYRWYDYNPITTRPGPADKITLIGSAYTQASARNADQLAATSTYKTASRKHWGRSYWPIASVPNVDTTYGRLASATMSGFGAILRTLLITTGSSGQVNPVVVSLQYHAVMGIKELAVDNVLDVIRSRRAKAASARYSVTS